MAEHYFDEQRAFDLFLEWKKTSDLRTLEALLQAVQPVVAGVISAKPSTACIPHRELQADCLERLSRVLAKYDPCRGRLFTYVTRATESAMVDATRLHFKFANRHVALDDFLLATLGTNGAEHAHALADIRWRVMQVRSASTCPHERAAQRWLVVNLLESGFVFRRHEAADSMSVVFGLGPRQARRLYDGTILAIRRLLLPDRRLKPVTRWQLVGTRGMALWQYRSELTTEEFSKLVFLMKNLAPAIIGAGGLSLSEVIYGPKAETALFPDKPEVKSAKSMATSSPTVFALENRRSPTPSVIPEKPRIDLSASTPVPLLAGSSQAQFGANLRDLERTHKRP